MSNPVTDFMFRLTSMSYELAEVYQQHIADQDELLPHVLMGEITRLVISKVRREQTEWLPKFLQQLELGLSSDNNDIKELIGVSFVENLCGEDEVIQTLLPTMEAALRREIQLICGV
jgi:hypothetical protein